jgi:hypothetical protein
VSGDLVLKVVNVMNPNQGESDEMSFMIGLLRGDELVEMQ